MRRMLRVIEDIQTYVSSAFKKHHFEFGELYINANNIVYVIDNEYQKCFNNAKQYIENFEYANVNMANQIGQFLPKIIKTFEVEDKSVMILEKNTDLILLQDAVTYYGGRMDSKAVAWILSSLYNIVCYFNYAKISHKDISLSTYFISPKSHNGVLLGGWWYANKLCEKIDVVPSRTFNFLSIDVKKNKMSVPAIDLDLIKALGRECLGDLKGDNLIEMKAAPEPMINWLRACSNGHAADDYAHWRNTIIKASFGGQFFTPMNLETSEIYN